MADEPEKMTDEEKEQMLNDAYESLGEALLEEDKEKRRKGSEKYDRSNWTRLPDGSYVDENGHVRDDYGDPI